MVNGKSSSTQYFHAGVPQGSILGPLLFIIYTNDLADHISSNIRLYADDSSIFEAGTNPKHIEDKLNMDLKSLTEWARFPTSK